MFNPPIQNSGGVETPPLFGAPVRHTIHISKHRLLQFYNLHTCRATTNVDSTFGEVVYILCHLQNIVIVL